MARYDRYPASEPEQPSAAETRAAIPAAVEAAQDAQEAAEAAVASAETVSPAAAEAAAAVVEAADAAVETLSDTAGEVKSKSGTRLCPKCKGELIKHSDENPEKAGAYHCNACGTCWAPGLRHPR